MKTGRYATVGSGRGAGDDYDLPGVKHVKRARVELCARDACVADGDTDRATIRTALAQRTAAIVACYEGAKQRAAGELVIAFEITEEGKVRRAVGRGEIGRCVAGVVSRVAFPTAWRATKVTFPMSFTES